MNTGLEDLRKSLDARGLANEFRVFDTFGDAVSHVVMRDEMAA